MLFLALLRRAGDLLAPDDSEAAILHGVAEAGLPSRSCTDPESGLAAARLAIE
jgi:hypothetical protein